MQLFILWTELDTVLPNKQVFLCLSFCSTLNPPQWPQPHLFLMFASFHAISYLSIFISQCFSEEIATAIAIAPTETIRTDRTTVASQ
jgi:hypothetical protein